MSLIAVVSGGFDPIHIGHIRYLSEASDIGLVYVLLNSDAWLIRKKQKLFMSFEERSEILKSLRCVEKVLAVDDADNSVVEGLRFLSQIHDPGMLVFCNGGDRIQTNTPEVTFCQENGIKMRFGIGGGKVCSSSELLAKWEK